MIPGPHPGLSLATRLDYQKARAGGKYWIGDGVDSRANPKCSGGGLHVIVITLISKAKLYHRNAGMKYFTDLFFNHKT